MLATVVAAASLAGSCVSGVSYGVQSYGFQTYAAPVYQVPYVQAQVKYLPVGDYGQADLYGALIGQKVKARDAALEVEGLRAELAEIKALLRSPRPTS